jgi:acetyl/propionyl-CoA carboxylase alpha subunit
VETGNDVTLYYDSLLGKIIVWGANRAEAITRMRRALQEMIVAGVATNQMFHLRLLENREFLAGEIDSQFLDRRPELLDPSTASAHVTAMAVAAALAEEEARQSRKPVVTQDETMRGQWLATARLEGLR